MFTNKKKIPRTVSVQVHIYPEKDLVQLLQSEKVLGPKKLFRESSWDIKYHVPRMFSEHIFGSAETKKFSEAILKYPENDLGIFFFFLIIPSIFSEQLITSKFFAKYLKLCRDHTRNRHHNKCRDSSRNIQICPVSDLGTIMFLTGRR